MKYFLTFGVLLFFLFSACDQSGNKKNLGKSTDKETKTQKRNEGPLIQMQIGQSSYYISLPADYSISESPGPDFSVYYFSPKDTTKTAEFFGGIYFGNFPDEFSPDHESCKSEERTSKILEEKGIWTVINCGGIYSIQIIAESKSGEDWNKFVHAFGHSNSDSGLESLFEVYKTFKKL